MIELVVSLVGVALGVTVPEPVAPPESEPEAPAAAAAPATELEPVADDEDGLRWFAVPNVAFDTDDGLGFGARGELALDAPGYTPYQSSFVLHLFLTTRGFHQHLMRYDRTSFGPGRRLRLTAYLAWRQWLNDGYWGIGNGTMRERAFVGPFDGGDPRRKRYRYTLFQPFVHVTLRAKISEAWQAFVSVNPKWSAVRLYDGSLLGEQRPYGMDGGLSVITSAGVLYDTREPEITPRQGILVEVSGRLAPPVPESAGTFGGGFVSARGFLSVGSRVTLAARGMAEWLFGDIPFYEMVHWGGMQPTAGFGGANTIRGIAYGRWHAPGKAIANLEARFDIGTTDFRGDSLQGLVVPYVDAGIVFGAGSLRTAPDAGFPVHPAAGLSLRAVYAEAFVGRIDSGFGIDPVRAASGRVRNELTWGMYLVFDHPF